MISKVYVDIKKNILFLSFCFLAKVLMTLQFFTLVLWCMTYVGFCEHNVPLHFKMLWVTLLKRNLFTKDGFKILWALALTFLALISAYPCCFLPSFTCVHPFFSYKLGQNHCHLYLPTTIIVNIALFLAFLIHFTPSISFTVIQIFFFTSVFSLYISAEAPQCTPHRKKLFL